MKSILQKVILFLGLTFFAHGADLTSNGNWIQTVTAANLVSGAGSDLPAKFESIAGVTTLTIVNAPGTWTLRARCGGNQGNSDVAVYVKRTSNGSGPGSIAGGAAYVELTSTNAEIFSGSEARNGISLQFKLTGLSRSVPPATYLSSIIFTIQ